MTEVSPDDYEYIIETDHKGDSTFQILQWTTEPPTQLGWYWATWTKSNDCTVVLVTTRSKEETALVAGVPGFAQPFEIHYFHLWLGPLPVPALPSTK